MTTAQVKQHWLHYDSSSITNATITTWAPRLALFVGNAWEGTLNQSWLNSFRAGNPNIKCYVYKDISSTRTGDPGPGNEYAAGLGMSKSAAHAAHPSWFLTRSGTDITMSGFSSQFVMNVGIKAYQDAWAAAVIADCQANNWDGVFADNCLYSLSQYSIAPCDQYANDAAFQGAYASFIAEVAPQFAAAGLGFCPNIAGIRVQPAAITAYENAGMTACFDEFWIDVSNSGGELPEYNQGWSVQVGEMTHATGLSVAQPQSNGSGDDPQSFRYAYATWFCCFNSSNTIAFGEMNDNYGPPPIYRTEYTYNLGTPTGAYTQPFTNVFRRNFTGGIAIVNANSSGSQTVSLGGSYVDMTGATVSSVTLSGLHGMVFRALNTTVSATAVQAIATVTSNNTIINATAVQAIAAAPSASPGLGLTLALMPMLATALLPTPGITAVVGPVSHASYTDVYPGLYPSEAPGPPPEPLVEAGPVGATQQHQDKTKLRSQPDLILIFKNGVWTNGTDPRWTNRE